MYRSMTRNSIEYAQYAIEAFERRQATLREEQQARNRDTSLDHVPSNTCLLTTMVLVVVWYILLSYVYGLDVKDMIQIYLWQDLELK